MAQGESPAASRHPLPGQEELGDMRQPPALPEGQVTEHLPHLESTSCLPFLPAQKKGRADSPSFRPFRGRGPNPSSQREALYLHGSQESQFPNSTRCTGTDVLVSEPARFLPVHGLSS